MVRSCFLSPSPSLSASNALSRSVQRRVRARRRRRRLHMHFDIFIRMADWLTTFFLLHAERRICGNVGHSRWHV